MKISESFHFQKVIHVAIVTISDTRTIDNDKSGQLIAQLLQEQQHTVYQRMVCKDETNDIREIMTELLCDAQIDVIITNGGTGIAARDCSIEAIRPFFTKEIVGFGELFRYLSFAQDIGTKAMLSRAVAGVANNKALFVLPGSTGAVRLAVTKLILPELSHIVYELTK